MNLMSKLKKKKRNIM